MKFDYPVIGMNDVKWSEAIMTDDGDRMVSCCVSIYVSEFDDIIKIRHIMTEGFKDIDGAVLECINKRLRESIDARREF